MAPGKAEKGGPRSWHPASHVGDTAEVPGFGLALPRLLWSFEVKLADKIRHPVH